MTAEGTATPLSFTPESLSALESRAIDPSLAAKLGIRPVLEPQHLPAELRKRWDGPGLVVGWTGLDGSVVPQYRPDEPTVTETVNGKLRSLKYLFPKGCGTPFNWLLPPVSDTGPVLLVEGALKGPAAALAAPGGLAVVAVPGCRVGKEADLSWAAKRSVYVCFDADLSTNPDVWDGAFWLRQSLLELGATEVRFLSVGSGKDGIDDVLGKLAPEKRREAMREWIETASDKLPAKPVQMGGKILPNPKWASEVASVLAAEYVDDAGNPTLINRDGAWFHWAGPHWVELTDSQVASELWLRTETSFYVKIDKDGLPVTDDLGRPKLVPWNPTRATIGELRTALQARLDNSRSLGADILDGVWLKGRSSDRVMSFSNGLLNLRTRRMIGHTAAYFNLSSVPYAYDPDAPAPVEWLKFLDSVWGTDAESIALLQEWFGYVISGRLDMEAMLLLLGPKRSGKSVMMYILQAMVGMSNSIGLTMSMLGTNFGLQRAIGMTCGVVGDARLQRNDAVPVMERLLMISDGSSITIDRKNQKAWRGVMSMRLTILSNRIPEFPDESGAMAARFQTLATVTSFEGREDRGIKGRCVEELSGILLWALAGLDRLTQQNQFTKPGASRVVIDTSRRQAAPVSAFLDDWCATGPETEETKADVYEAYKAWCAQEGVDHPMKLAQFAAALFETGRNVKAQRARRGGQMVQLFLGVRLRAVLKPGTGWSAPEEAEQATPAEATGAPLPDAQPPSGTPVPVPADGPLETAPSAAPVEELRAVVADPFAGDLDLGYE